MSANIFISFASQDIRIATTICKALESRGFECWISARNILPGENFQVAIVQAIRRARIMLLVFTANSNNSQEMTKELALASQQKLIVIPLRVEDVAPNDAFAYEFATRQWIDLFADWEIAMDQLSQRIANALTDRSAATPTPATLTEVLQQIDAEPAATLDEKLTDEAPAPDVEPPTLEPEIALVRAPAPVEPPASAGAAKRPRSLVLAASIGALVLVAGGGLALMAAKPRAVAAAPGHQGMSVQVHRPAPEPAAPPTAIEAPQQVEVATATPEQAPPPKRRARKAAQPAVDIPY